MTREASLDLECRPELVATARRFVSDVLRDWGLSKLEDDAQLVVSELVTNAVLHARTELTVKLLADRDGAPRLRLEVCDHSPRLPMATECLDGAPSGRGLGVVARLAADWGCELHPGGKVVWACLAEAPVAGVPEDVW